MKKISLNNTDQVWRKSFSHKKLMTQYGLDVHFILERIHFLWEKDERSFIKNCQFYSNSLLESDLKKIYRIIEKYPYLLTAFKEVELLTEEGLLRIDCLVETDDSLWVIDFKTGPRLRIYDAQIKRYVNGVSSLFPKRNVVGHILWIDLECLEQINDF